MNTNVRKMYEEFIDEPLPQRPSLYENVDSTARKPSISDQFTEIQGVGRSASLSMPQVTRFSIHESPLKLPMVNAFSPVRRKKFQPMEKFAVLQPTKKVDPDDEAKERQFMKNLEKSFEVLKEDAEHKPLVGPASVGAYYGHYKKIRKVQQQNQFFKLIDSPQTAMLRQSEGGNLLPCKMGMVKATGSEQQLQLSHQKFGDGYASVLSQGLKATPHIKEFMLSNNRLRSEGASQILMQIGKHAKVIDLQQNEIGALGCDAICQQIILRESKIEVLNLEDNKLGDKNITKTLKAILNSNNKLKVLNISKNFITNDVCDLIKELIVQNDNLEQLYLHWNQIKGAGGQKVFEGMIENSSMLVLDVSWNSLGVQEKKEVICVQKICEFLSTNKSVMHFDLSSNCFNLADSRLIANSLKGNRSIYGFHFAGNWGNVDPRGFLMIGEDEVQNIVGETLRIKGLEQVTNMRHDDVCWICEGWQEQQFGWVPEVSGPGECDPVFVHLAFEQYKQVYIPKKNDETTILPLMIPPGTNKYLYTVIEQQTVAADQNVVPYSHPITVQLNGTPTTIQLDSINTVVKQKRFAIIEPHDLKPTISVLPRTPDPIYIPPKMKKHKRVWTFPISIWFKDFKFETEDLLRKCFEKDWSCCKVAKVIKNPDEFAEVKLVAWQYYRQIKETYKWYSSYNPTGDIWSITTNVITEFAQVTEVVDNKTLKLSDLDLKFIATCAASIEYKGNPRNPERALCRFQFMEFIFRVAEDKYFKTKQAANMLEASKMILEQCTGIMSQYNAQKWRDERYFNEKCDDCCKFFKNLINNVYNKYSVKKVKPGQKKFMCLDELHEICQVSGLFDGVFVERDANLAFNLSMLLQVDELENDRIFQMTYIEFMEALARIAEKISLAGIGTEDLNYEQRQAQPLHIKLEKLLVVVTDNCASEDYKLQFGSQKITKSMFDVVEEDD